MKLLKRPPRSGELRLTHLTTNSGDTRTIALSADCFDPSLIAMLKPAVNRVRVYAVDFGPLGLLMTGEGDFTVLSDDLAVSHNLVTRDDAGNIFLTTTVEAVAVLPGVLAMAADFEQCVEALRIDLRRALLPRKRSLQRGSWGRVGNPGKESNNVRHLEVNAYLGQKGRESQK